MKYKLLNVQALMKLFLHQIGKKSITFGENWKKVKTCISNYMPSGVTE